jgi:rfaE bifunctional protein nucleotidyltransferase chain/domain
MGLHEKIIAWDRLPGWREELRRRGARLVVTNGCFDILHAGHVVYLDAARQQGDVLLVGLNSDASVRELKGPDRPINPQADRALVLAALQCVDGVCVFNERGAGRFLSVAQPDIYVKGGDYSVEQLPKDELETVRRFGGEIRVMPGVAGKSTTDLLARIAGM